MCRTMFYVNNLQANYFQYFGNGFIDEAYGDLSGDHVWRCRGGSPVSPGGQQWWWAFGWMPLRNSVTGVARRI